MICPKCGASAQDGDNFCEECGASLKKHVNKAFDCDDNSESIKSEVMVVDPSLASACNIGRKHPKNEDAGYVSKCNDGSVIMVVSDGVSSAVNAVSASVHAVKKVDEVLSSRSSGALELVKTAIDEANEIIIGLPYETREDGIYGPEATIVTALIEGDNVFLGWVGDSRAYILNENEQKLLTVDDSWIELVVASGEMTRDEALQDARAHYVTQVLGMHDQPMEVHTLEQKLEKGQMLLLCTDGLWNYLPGNNDLLNQVLDFGMDKCASEICEHLVSLANRAGGHDNITVAIYKYI